MVINAVFCTFHFPAFWGVFCCNYLYFKAFRGFFDYDSIVYFILMPIVVRFWDNRRNPKNLKLKIKNLTTDH